MPVYEFTGVSLGSGLSVDEQDQLIYAASAPGVGWTVIAAETSPTILSITPHEALIDGTNPLDGTTPLQVSLSGTYFLNTATVTFGGTAAINVTIINQHNITCFVPAHAVGDEDVIVTNPDTGSFVTRTVTLTDGFSYILPDPVVTSVFATATLNPEGTTAGSTAVTIKGNNFAAGATVIFGDLYATSVVVTNSQQITCITPAHDEGLVDIIVTVPNA